MSKLHGNQGWQAPPDIIASCSSTGRSHSNGGRYDISADQAGSARDTLEHLQRATQDLEQAGDDYATCRALDNIAAVLPDKGSTDDLPEADEAMSFQMLVKLEDLRKIVNYAQMESLHHLILHRMREFPQTTTIQHVGCQLLVRLMWLSGELCGDIQTSDAYMLVLDMCFNHASDPVIQSTALQAVAILALAEPTRQMLLYSENDAVEAAISAMTSFPDILDIQAKGCSALYSIVKDEPLWQKKLIDRNVHQMVLQALESHQRHGSVVTQACQLLSTFAEQELFHKSARDQGAEKVLMSCMKQHFADGAIVLHCLVLLLALSSQRPAFLEGEAGILSEGDLGPVLLSMLSLHKHDENIQAAAIGTWTNVADLWFDQLGDHQEESWLDRVHQAFSLHLMSAHVQEVCCGALAKLLEHCSGLQSLIGEERANGEKPLHTCCGLALLVHGGNVAVFKAACDAIYWCSADNELLQSLLVEKNVHLEICRGMKEHRREAKAQEQGCRAIKGLAIFSQSSKQKVALDGALNELRRALKNFPDIIAVQVEALAAIACLADTELVRSECMASEVYWNVLLAMKSHLESDLLQETVLETLTILSGAEGAVEKLLESGAMERVIVTMRQHADSAVIQKKGVVVIQLLGVSDQPYTKTNLCHDLVKVIINAMNSHQGAFGVQSEGCVAMQVLAEKNEFISEVLVDCRAHECLFNILRNYQLAKDLQDLASECLFVLGCHRNLKSQMLLAACSKGHKAGVECLVELGAEVNIGEGVDTPLCHACRIGDEHLVAFLLSQGVSDLQLALQISLGLGHARIVGMLLKNVGHDTEGGMVSWSGLSLGDVQQEWLYATFMEVPHQKAVSETGRSLAVQVRETETRRRKRRSSESSLLTSTRLPMRFRFEQQTPSRLNLRDFPSWVPNFDDIDSDEVDAGEATCLPVRINPLEVIKAKLQRKKSSPAKLGSPPGGNIPYSSNTWPIPPRRDYKTRAELIQSIKHKASSEVGESCHFTMGVEELDEWKRFTLTSSNVPFSPLDPRVSDTPDDTRQHSVHSASGVWMRKKWSSQSALLQSLADEAAEGATVSQVGGEVWKAPRLRHSTSECALTSWRTAFPAVPSHGNHSESTSEMPPITDEALSDKQSGRDYIWEAGDVDAGAESADQGLKTPNIEAPIRRIRRNTSHDHSFSGKRNDTSIHSRKKMIRSLELANNGISSLDGLLRGDARFLRQLSGITKLDLSQNKLQTIPDQVFQSLVGLENLNLSYNEFSQFPETVLTCQQLSVLEMGHNKLSGSDGVMDHMTLSLKTLVLSHNCLRAVPAWLGPSCPALETLNLSSNEIEDLTECSLQLKRLKVLNLAYNKLPHIPSHFLPELPLLESLTLDGNHLEGLPAEACSSLLPRLTTLRVAHNKLSGKEPFFLPKFILELPSVRVVNISHNQLTGFPESSLWKTSSLRELNVAHNQIRKLTFGAGPKAYAAMERLNVSHNKLQELPREIGQLVLLNSLDISHNPGLTTVPDELGRLSKLWEFHTHGLKLDLDEAILKGRTRNLVRYLHEKLKRSVEYHHMKLMVVGYGGRGKTSLLRQLTRNGDHSNQPTVGVVVREWKISGLRLGRSTFYTLHTWDFAGQEDFYSTHQCFLSNRAVYLVVYDLNRGMHELDTLRPWLLNIAARAPACPVVIVGTHLDLLPKDEKDDKVVEMRQAIWDMCKRPGFPSVVGMVEADCTRDNTGIERLRTKIKDVIDSFEVKGQRVIEQKIPASYLRLQNLLSEEAYILKHKLPIITHRRICKIVKEAKLDLDEEELQQAVRFLHEAGVLLHYEDAALKLSDLYFLDPEWLCRMMAQIVTVREINPFINRDGIMKRENVKVLFPDRRGGETSNMFPAHLIPQYLRLLEKFEIALPHSEEELLIPCRLPVQRPLFDLPGQTLLRMQQGPVVETHARVQRRYEMQYIPIGFWSRLITRLLGFASSKLMELDIGEKTPTEVQLWREGIYVCYSTQAYFLVEQLDKVLEVVMVTVPESRQGYRLLGQVVDQVDGLIEEWYPGLTDKNPSGDALVDRKIPCIKCHGTPHMFRLVDLVKQSETEDTVYCPRHKAHVPLASLAPDLVLSDLDEHLILPEKVVSLVESPENLLGSGAFGRVYKGRFRNQRVAIKLFLPVGDIHPHRLMRQEVTILRRLDHPSLVSLVGVCLRRRLLMLELAPQGSLASMLSQGRITGHHLQHRIALQVSEGLSYLHRYMIIYRDMKPDNILIFSVSLAVPVNAKLSDYGISRFISPYGLSLPEGTPGYRAPEVARGEAYSFQADVFSLGITVYELATGGQHPYPDFSFHNELDEAVMRGAAILPISKVAPPWPDMQELVDQCLKQVPEERPSSEKVCDMLRKVDLLCLRQVIPISKHTGVECMAVKHCPGDEPEVWLACGVASIDRPHVQLARVTLTSSAQEPKGLMHRGGRVLCMLALGPAHMLLGTQTGKMCVYSCAGDGGSHVLAELELPDAVLTLVQHSRSREPALVIAGLADGQLAVYEAEDILSLKLEEEGVASDVNGGNPRLQSKHVLPKPRLICVGGEQGQESQPVRVLHVYHQRATLYASVGSKIFVYTLQSLPELKVFWNTDLEGTSSCQIRHLVVGGKRIHMTKRDQSVVEMWHTKEQRRQKTVKVSTIISVLAGNAIARETSNYESRITAVALVTSANALWIGTHCGHLVLLDASSYNHLLVTRRHLAEIRCISWVKSGSVSMVMTGGVGFTGLDELQEEVCHSQGQREHRESSFGYLAMWDHNMGQQQRHLQDYEKRRQDWTATHCRKTTV